MAALVAALVASAVCFALLPGEALGGSLVQTAVLAAIALVAVAVAHPRVLCVPLRKKGVLSGWMVYVLVVGTAAGVVSFGALPQGAELGLRPALFVQVGALCLLTGVFEEGVFRVLAMDAFAPALGGGRRGLLAAAVVSSVLFGVLHVSLGDASSAVGVVAVAQSVLKPLQAGLFGFFMAGVYVATRNLWVPAIMHGAFNFVYTGPLLLTGGFQQTYVTGNPFDLALLAATVLLLVPPVLAAARAFLENSSSR